MAVKLPTRIACSATLAVSGLLVSRSPALGQAMFQGLGYLAGATHSVARAISADGTTVVGYSGLTNAPDVAFRWTQSEGMQSLGTLPGLARSDAWAVSANGTVVVGNSAAPGGISARAFRWTAAAGMENLGTFSGGSDSEALGLTADGNTIVGYSFSGSFAGYRACRWVGSSAIEQLPTPGVPAYSQAVGVSADGMLIAGHTLTLSGGPTDAVRWQAGGPPVPLPGLGGGYSIASAISLDGSVVVGTAHRPNGTAAAARWSAVAGLLDLGVLPGRANSMTFGVSADGSVVVGTSWSPLGSRAFVWTAGGCMRDIQSLLDAYGVELAGWTLDRATGVAADGLTITGFGFDPAGSYQAWIARVPRCYANCDGSTATPALNVNDFQCFLNHFAAGHPYANCDCSTASPLLNVNDFTCYLNQFAAGCS